MATKLAGRGHSTVAEHRGGEMFVHTGVARPRVNSAPKLPEIPARPLNTPLSNSDYSKSGNEKAKSSNKKTNTNKKVDKAALFKSRARLFLHIVVFFAVGIWMISRYINIYESGSRAAKLKTEYSKLETENQQLKLQIDKSVDLKMLEGIATERFGMIRPERHQLFYIDMHMSDYGEKVTKKNDKDQMNEAMVYGVPGVLIKAIETLK